MSENNWPSIMKVKLYHELMDIIEQPEKHSAEEINAATLELKQRGLYESPVIETENIESAEVLDSDDVSGSQYFPPKPVLQKSGPQSPISSVISLGLFIGLFYLVFGWDLNFIFLLVGVILIHEIGHLMAMRLFKFEDLSIFFIPLVGAMASGEKEKVTQLQRSIILLSGPLPGVIIGSLLYYFGLQNNHELMIQSGNIFILLNLFNLLPIMPLDGGRLIQTLFFEANEIINAIFLWISILLISFYALYAESFIMLILPVFLYMQFNGQMQVRNIRKGLKRKGIGFEKSYEELTDQEYWRIRDEIASYIKSFAAVIIPGNHQYSLAEGRIIKQIKAIIRPRPIRNVSVLGKILFMIIWLFSFVIPFVMMALYMLGQGTLVFP